MVNDITERKSGRKAMHTCGILWEKRTQVVWLQANDIELWATKQKPQIRVVPGTELHFRCCRPHGFPSAWIICGLTFFGEALPDFWKMCQDGRHCRVVPEPWRPGAGTWSSTPRVKRGVQSVHTAEKKRPCCAFLYTCSTSMLSCFSCFYCSILRTEPEALALRAPSPCLTLKTGSHSAATLLRRGWNLESSYLNLRECWDYRREPLCLATHFSSWTINPLLTSLLSYFHTKLHPNISLLHKYF